MMSAPDSPQDIVLYQKEEESWFGIKAPYWSYTPPTQMMQQSGLTPYQLGHIIDSVNEQAEDSFNQNFRSICTVCGLPLAAISFAFLILRILNYFAGFSLFTVSGLCTFVFAVCIQLAHRRAMDSAIHCVRSFVEIKLNHKWEERIRWTVIPQRRWAIRSIRHNIKIYSVPTQSMGTASPHDPSATIRL